MVVGRKSLARGCVYIKLDGVWGLGLFFFLKHFESGLRYVYDVYKIFQKNVLEPNFMRFSTFSPFLKHAEYFQWRVMLSFPLPKFCPPNPKVVRETIHGRPLPFLKKGIHTMIMFRNAVLNST